MLSPDQREKVSKVPRLRDELRCQVIVPHAPTSVLFPLMTVPQAPSEPGAVRLIGPSMKKPPIRLEPVCKDHSKLSHSSPSTTCERYCNVLHSPALSDHESASDSDQSSASSSPVSPTLAALLEREREVRHQVRDTQRASWHDEQFGRPATLAPGDLLERFSNEAEPSFSSSPPTLPRRFGFSKAAPPASNPIAQVSLSPSQHAVVYPVNGTLASLSTAEMASTQRLADVSQPNDVYATRSSFVLGDERVTHVRTASAIGSDPARVVAATSDTVAFGTISDSHCLSLHNVHSVSILDVAVSAHVDEVAMLTPFAIRAMPSVLLSNAVHHDVQPLEPSKAFSSIAYSTHPRVLILASRFSLSTIDLRLRAAASASPLFRVSDWRLPSYDDSITAFIAPRSSFQAVLATRTRVAYFDTRVPKQPFLQIPYSHAVPVSRLAVLQHRDIDHADSLSDVIAFGNPACKVLSIAQVVRSVSNDFASDPASTLQQFPFAWGGEPFHVGHALPSMSYGDCPGLAFLSSSESHRTHVISWSASTGLTAIPFNLRPATVFGDDGSVDSSDDEENVHGAAPSSPLSSAAALDSSLNVAKDRKRLIAAGLLAPLPSDLEPLTASVGATLHECTRKLPARLALQIRKCICSESADVVTGGLRIPHPSTNGVGFKLDDHAVNACLNQKAQELQRLPPFSLDDVTKLIYNCQSTERAFQSTVDALDALDRAEVLRGEAIAWHEGCPQRAHHFEFPGCVSTEDSLPDWVNKLVYFGDTASSGDPVKNGAHIGKETGDFDVELVAPRASEYGQMMQRAWQLFFGRNEVQK